MNAAENGSGRSNRFSLQLFVSTLTTVLLFSHSIYFQFQVIKRQEDNEYRLRIWEEEAKLYSELAEALGEVGSNTSGSLATDRKQSFEAMRAFQKLYWGRALLVRDDAIELHLKDFYLALVDYEDGWLTEQELLIKIDGINAAMRSSLRRPR